MFGISTWVKGGSSSACRTRISRETRTPQLNSRCNGHLPTRAHVRAFGRAYTAYLRLISGSCGRPTRASANVTEHSSKACVSNRPCCPVFVLRFVVVHSLRVLSVCPFCPDSFYLPLFQPTRRYPISVIRRHIVIGCTRHGRRRRSRSRHTGHQSHQFALVVEAAQRLPGSSRARTYNCRRASRRPSGSRSSCPPVSHNNNEIG